MAGSEQFNQQSIISAITSESVILDSSITNTVVAVNGSEVILIVPDEGFIAELVNMYLNVPAITGTASGTHTLSIRSMRAEVPWLSYMLCTSVFNNYIKFYAGAWVGNTPSPDSVTGCMLVLGRMVFNHTNPLAIQYDNNTNVQSDNTRSYLYILHVKKVA